MRQMTTSILTPRKLVLRIGVMLPAVFLSACQLSIPFPRQSAPARLLPDQDVSVAGVTAANSTSAPASDTFTVKRDTLRDTLDLSGRVVPGRSAQLIFHGSGTINSVYVASGQSVKQGDILADFTLDEESLRAARSQATLADLTYQNELDKLKQLQAPGGSDSIQQMRVTIERDQAEIQKLQQEQAGVQATGDRNQKALETAQSAADRKVTYAEFALQTANDGLASAQSNLKAAQDDAQDAQLTQTSDQQQSAADAAGTAASASANVRAASRQLDEAQAKLELAQLDEASSGLGQQIEVQQLRVDQETDALKDARAAATAADKQTPSAEHSSQQIAAEVANAQAGVKAAERALATDTLELKHLKANVEGAKRKDVVDVKAATFAVDAAKEQLASAQLAEQKAQQRAQAVANRPAPTAPPRTSRQSVAAASAAVQQAEATVRTAELNLEDAQSAQAAAADATQAPPQFADHQLTAAKAQLSADQAKLTALEGSNSASEIDRQQARVNLLREQATAAAAAAQPVVSPTAPFDATVAEVTVSTGQTIVNGTTVDATANDARVPAIRLAATGTDSILADASESEVASLTVGQTVNLSFPGLLGQSGQGRVADVGAIATIKNNQSTYPVRIEMVSPPSTVKFGMTAQASLALTEAKDVLVAPRTAIRTAGGQTLVDKLDTSNHVQGVPVQVGRTFGNNVELLGGVQEGDVLAVYNGVTAAAPKLP